MEKLLLTQSKIERRKPKRLKFYNKANLRIGRQDLPNRWGESLNDLPFDWTNGIADDTIRKNLKKH